MFLDVSLFSPYTLPFSKHIFLPSIVSLCPNNLIHNIPFVVATTGDEYSVHTLPLSNSIQSQGTQDKSQDKTQPTKPGFCGYKRNIGMLSSHSVHG